LFYDILYRDDKPTTFENKNNSQNEHTGTNNDCPMEEDSKDDIVQNAEDKNEVENNEMQQRDLYAVVNKTKKVGGVKDENPRTCNKNEEGLTYTQVEFTGNVDRSPSTPFIKLVSQENESDRVTYSEVIIENQL